MKSDIIWEPTQEYSSNCLVQQFMNEHGINDYDALIARSVNDRQWFWTSLEKFLKIKWDNDYHTLYSDENGKEWTRWFVGGKLNLFRNIVEFDLENNSLRTAFIAECEEGTSQSYTYGELNKQVSRVAYSLNKIGVKPGDPVALIMPMIPEVVFAFLAIIKIGAISVPIFSGFGENAIKSRVHDVGAKLLFTAFSSTRNGKKIFIEQKVLASIRDSSTIQRIIVFRNQNEGQEPLKTKCIDWNKFLDGAECKFPTKSMDASDPCMVLYSSGTTGKPKGTVHGHAGALLSAAQEAGFAFDMKVDSRMFWFSDLGWMMGPWQIFGSLFHRGSFVIYEGGLTFPKPDTLWRIVEKNKVTILGISPTGIRILLKHGKAWVERYNLQSLKFLGSTGETWDTDSYLWYFQTVGKQKLPIINISGGTEIFGCFLSPLPITSLKVSTLRGPGLGKDVDVVDEAGMPIREEIGHLICREHVPSMTLGFWNNNNRYLETYWSKFKGLWYHGDLAYIDADGFWFLLGRSDDLIKIGGKRIGPAEYESAAMELEEVIEAAAIGVDDALKGNAVILYVVVRNRTNSALKSKIFAHLNKMLGKPFIPKQILFTEGLPKTRSGKIVRNVIVSLFNKEKIHDVSAIENEETIEMIKNAN